MRMHSNSHMCKRCFNSIPLNEFFQLPSLSFLAVFVLSVAAWVTLFISPLPECLFYSQGDFSSSFFVGGCPTDSAHLPFRLTGPPSSSSAALSSFPRLAVLQLAHPGPAALFFGIEWAGSCSQRAGVRWDPVSLDTNVTASTEFNKVHPVIT